MEIERKVIEKLKKNLDDESTWRKIREDESPPPPNLSDVIPNIYEVRGILKKCWSKDTAYPESLKNGKKCPSRGQCFVTAVLIKDLFGGEILQGIVNGENHFWNIIDGIEVDLTSDQYGGDGYHPIVGIYGKVSKIKGKSNRRYKVLRKLWDKYEAEAYIW